MSESVNFPTYVYVLHEDTLDDEARDVVRAINLTTEGAMEAAKQFIVPAAEMPGREPKRTVWQRPRHTKDFWRLSIPATYGRTRQEFWIQREDVGP